MDYCDITQDWLRDASERGEFQMFQIGESVVYGTTGVCTISAIGPLTMHGVDRKREYYTLQPVYQEGAVYVPAQGETRKQMRYPLSSQEAEQLLERIPEIRPCEIEHFNYKQRTEAFSTALHQNECDSLVSIIKAVEQKKRHVREKQQYNVDNNFMKRAMNLLCGELSFSLGISLEESRQRVEQAIRSQGAVKGEPEEAVI